MSEDSAAGPGFTIEFGARAYRDAATRGELGKVTIPRDDLNALLAIAGVLQAKGCVTVLPESLQPHVRRVLDDYEVRVEVT